MGFVPGGLQRVRGRGGSAKAPLFQSRHYERAARLVRNYPPAQMDMLIEAFLEFFEDDNPNFDRQRFVNACQLPK